MDYVPVFTTKDNIAEYSRLIKASDISDSILKKGEALVWSELKRNGRFDQESVDTNDERLMMAAEFATLHLIAKYNIISGFYGHPSHVSNKLTANINIAFGDSYGGQTRRTQEIDQEIPEPDFYHAFQRMILAYLQDPANKGKRIDEVIGRFRNPFEKGGKRVDLGRGVEQFILPQNVILSNYARLNTNVTFAEMKLLGDLFMNENSIFDVDELGTLNNPVNIGYFDTIKVDNLIGSVVGLDLSGTDNDTFIINADAADEVSSLIIRNKVSGLVQSLITSDKQGNLFLIPYTGKYVEIESVRFKSGAVSGVTSLQASGMITSNSIESNSAVINNILEAGTVVGDNVTEGTDPGHEHTLDSLDLTGLTDVANNQLRYLTLAKIPASTLIDLGNSGIPDEAEVYLDGDRLEKDTTSTTNDYDYWLQSGNINFTFHLPSDSVIQLYWADS